MNTRLCGLANTIKISHLQTAAIDRFECLKEMESLLSSAVEEEEQQGFQAQ
jgi:hypothetical protein